MSGDGRRVLVVEDDEALAQALRDLLIDEGYVVDVRFDGESGLHAALDGAFDLIILDLMLPKRNGFSVCREIRAAGTSTPLLILTAKDGELDEVEGLELGADDFLRKPFERLVFLARINALLRRHERDVTGEHAVGDVVVDPSRHTVAVRGASVSLTPREYKVLEVLMGAAGPCSKATLLEKVWGSDFDGDPNIVEVYIGYLRRKFDEAAGAASLIHTVRGTGYQLVIGD